MTETPSTVASPGPLTDGEVRELSRLEAGATPAPWGIGHDTKIVRGFEATGVGSYTCISAVAEVADEDDREMWMDDDERYVYVEPEVDAEFITAARNLLPRLLADRQRQAAELAHEQTRTEMMAYQRGAIMDVSLRLNPREAVDRIDEILRAGMTAEAKGGWADELGRTVAERDAAHAELAAARQEADSTRAGVAEIADRLHFVADSVAGGPFRHSLIADLIRAALMAGHCRVEDAEGVTRCVTCRLEWPCGNPQLPALAVPTPAETEEPPAAIWCNRHRVLVGPEQLAAHNAEHHPGEPVPAATGDNQGDADDPLIPPMRLDELEAICVASHDDATPGDTQDEARIQTDPIRDETMP